MACKHCKTVVISDELYQQLSENWSIPVRIRITGPSDPGEIRLVFEKVE